MSPFHDFRRTLTVPSEKVRVIQFRNCHCDRSVLQIRAAPQNPGKGNFIIKGRKVSWNQRHLHKKLQAGKKVYGISGKNASTI